MSEAAAPPPARLLDVTRLLRRSGRVPTGVDRVERAYLRALLEAREPLFLVARTRLGYILCDSAGAQALHQSWASLPDRKSGERLLRRHAIARAVPWRLAYALMRHLPKGFAYLNVGHSNLTDRVLSAMHNCGARIAVMVHDTIPLDYPDTQRPETSRKFRSMLDRVAIHADVLICNSEATRADVERHVKIPPRIVVAHLGVDVSDPKPEELPAGLPPKGAFFVTLGTIEPRKNHALLLEIWEHLAKGSEPLPTLLICGNRGWLNQEVFDRLDAGQRGVVECSNLSDGAMAALFEKADGALFPSYAEGYGLPQMEAAAAQCPLICADLPVYGEFLGDIAVYVNPSDSYLWIRKIKDLTRARRMGTASREQFVPPSWETHFRFVLMAT